MGAGPGPGRSVERPGLALASLEQRDLAGAVLARLEGAVLLERRAALGSRGDGDRAIGQIVDQRRTWRRQLRIHPTRRRAGARRFGNRFAEGAATRRQIALAGS